MPHTSALQALAVDVRGRERRVRPAEARGARDAAADVLADGRERPQDAGEVLVRPGHPDGGDARPRSQAQADLGVEELRARARARVLVLQAEVDDADARRVAAYLGDEVALRGLAH